MEAGYSLLQSSNIYVEVFRESMPLIIAGILLYQYSQKRITIVDALLFAVASEAYTMIVIGPTITATFFISIYILLDQLHQLLTGQQYIRKEYLILLLLPLLSHIAVFLITQLYKNPFVYPNGKMTSFYIKPLYFYLKTYLPLFAIGGKIVQEREQLSFDQFITTVKKITKISCFIALIQIAVQVIFHINELSELLGLQSRYLTEQINGAIGVRVQALFSEPKIFSAFLSLSLPLFMHDRNYKMVILAFIIGVLTSSQTFWINIISAGLLYTVFYKIQSVRIKILGLLSMIIGIFLMVAASKEYFMQHYMENRNQPLYKMMFERAANRYDSEVWRKDNIVMGIPLQRDLELPVVDFLKDEPYLLFSGYGGGNSTFIPPGYFFGQLGYENRLAGIGANNLNMRWFYILAEFGAIALLFFFIILTRTTAQTSLFQKNYLAFVCTCFFFSQIDLFIIITALLSAYNNETINDNSYEESSQFAMGR